MLRASARLVAAATVSLYASVGAAQAATTTTVSANPSPSVVGRNVNLTATVNGAGSGNVQFQIDGADYGSPVAITGSGYAGLSDPSMPVGSHTISAVFNRGAADTSSGTTTHTVNPYSAQVSLTPSDPTPTPGEAVTFTAGVSGYVPSGSVQFVIDGQNAGPPVGLSSFAPNNALARYTTSTLPTGQHDVRATYLGDTNNTQASSPAVTVTVSGGSQQGTMTTVRCAGPRFPHPGDHLSCTATVTNAGGSAPPTGTVAFTIHTTTTAGSIGVCQLSPGPTPETARCAGGFTPARNDTYLLGASYHPDTLTFAPSFGALTITVTRARGGSSSKAPAVSRFTLWRRTFSIRGGTVFLFSLSKAARVKIAITGLRAGRRPVPIGLLTITGRPGSNRARFAGHVGAKTLPPGRYRATLTATDRSGHASAPRSANFTVVAN